METKPNSVLPESTVSRILPPKEDRESTTTSVRMPLWLFRRLGEIAEKTQYTRTQVIVHFLKWAHDEWTAEQQRAAEADAATAADSAGSKRKR